MKFYLSSYKIGNHGKDLARMLCGEKRIGYVPNAMDYGDNVRQIKKSKENMNSLKELGLKPELLNLRDYFGKEEKLRKKISELNGVFVQGGNTFVLKQAMKLSGFDIIFNELFERKDFVYSGYSAGICVLSKNLEALKIVDNPEIMPYSEIQETIWEGLGYLDYMILPHYKSNHPESADIDKEVENCKKKNIPYKTLRDGEVILIE